MNYEFRLLQFLPALGLSRVRLREERTKGWLLAVKYEFWKICDECILGRREEETSFDWHRNHKSHSAAAIIFPRV